ncbi:hypothetical protein [Variovorax sp. RA8]|uniref:hypothetical protein n=1 Tax=Variovorax sp. (strain JCM 16519 / RA8) TaxID=662548 RepID=UPI001317DB74|nr:hypothetical protein [Variovorax sp. RA8]VTU44226.1 hypothetical protein RA8P2_00100 [Variovorax sp. RA8]
MSARPIPPTIVFHGTSATFDAFAPNPRGIFFAEQFNSAASYQRIRKAGEPRVIAASVDIRNPWTIIRYGLDVPYSQQADQSATALKARGFDGMYMPHERVWVAFEPEQIGIVDHAVAPTCFVEHLQAASDQAEAGWHFEEDGCWGMALALRTALGPGSEIVLRDGFTHAYVRAGGRTFDWQGESDFTGGRVVTRDQLITEALAHGCSAEQLDADSEWADQIIERARQLYLLGDHAAETELTTAGQAPHGAEESIAWDTTHESVLKSPSAMA